MHFNKKTIIKSFKLLVTAKRKQGVIVERPELSVLWDDYVKSAVNQNLVKANVAKKWSNPYG